jgi:hypothetical protein
MSLRQRPILTPASLIARRANALRSTGPRTPEGKSRILLNALRHGQRARRLEATYARLPLDQQLAIARLYRVLYWAIFPNQRWAQSHRPKPHRPQPYRPQTDRPLLNGLQSSRSQPQCPSPRQLDRLLVLAVHVWSARRQLEREVRSEATKLRGGSEGRLPSPWQYSIRLRRRRVTISVHVRRARARSGEGWLPCAGNDGERPVHAAVAVRVTAPRRLPWYFPRPGAIGPTGVTFEAGM